MDGTKPDTTNIKIKYQGEATGRFISLIFKFGKFEMEKRMKEWSDRLVAECEVVLLIIF